MILALKVGVLILSKFFVRFEGVGKGVLILPKNFRALNVNSRVNCTVLAIVTGIGTTPDRRQLKTLILSTNVDQKNR